MPNFNYIPSTQEIIMMYTKALKIEQAERKRTSKSLRAKRKSELASAQQ